VASWLYRNLALPPQDLIPCGRHSDTQEKFFASSREDAKLVLGIAALGDRSKILDIGCGIGRFPIGLMALGAPFESYLGADVSKERIDWCEANLTVRDPRLVFRFVDMPNARYNPAGKGCFDLELDPKSFDLIHLYSVFSHLLERDVRYYLDLLVRTLKPDGVCFLTMFTADDVDSVSVNPERFGSLKWAGPLHCVLYNRGYWEQMISHVGLKVSRQIDNVNLDGQTGYFLSKR
jgi:SAM-dependent methyltransferase